jgi:hypothetical protein
MLKLILRLYDEPSNTFAEDKHLGQVQDAIDRRFFRQDKRE